MKAVSNLLLRVKHWQIFVALFATFCLAVAIQVREIRSAPRGQFPSAAASLVVWELLGIAFALWIWSSGMFLSSVAPPPFKMKLTLFRVSAIFLPIYLAAFGVFFESLTRIRNPMVTLVSFAVIFPLHLFAMFCQFYSWYFVSKNLAMAEKPQFAAFPDYVGYFFGLWFFPIGIWFIQPRINRLYASATSSLSS
jgi:hypothetical protein